MASLSFTPTQTYCNVDYGATLKIGINIEDWADYDDFTSLSVYFSLLNTGTTLTLDVTDRITGDLTGTCDGTVGTTTITGTNTLFLTELAVGDYISFSDETDAAYEIESISSNTSLTLAKGLGSEITSATAIYVKDYFYVYQTDFGIAAGSKLPDDVYQIVYTYTFEGSTDEAGSYSESVALIHNISCSIRSQIALIPNSYSCSKCNYEFVDEVARNYMLLKALEDSAYNASTTTFNYILNALNDISLYTENSCNC